MLLLNKMLQNVLSGRVLAFCHTLGEVCRGENYFFSEANEGKIWKNTEKFRKIRKNSEKFGKIQEKSGNKT